MEEPDKEEGFVARPPGTVLPGATKTLHQCKGNFLPWLMHPATFIGFAVVATAILGITEYLYQTSIRHIGLFKPEEQSGEVRLVFKNTVAQFFGMFVVVLIGLYSKDMDQTVKTMEPFYQLSRPKGSLGRHSLCTDYFRQTVYFTPFQALYLRHWAVVCSSTASIVSTNVLPTLALGIFITDESEESAMHPAYTRSFEVFLGLLILLDITLAIKIFRRQSGLDYFPSRFLTLITCTRMRHKPNSISSFINGLELEKGDEISEKELNKIFGPLRFQLIRPEGMTEDSSLELIVLENEPDPGSSWLSCISTCIPDFKWCREFRQNHLWTDNHPALFQTVPLSLCTLCLLTLFVMAAGQPFWANNCWFFAFLGSKRFARSSVSSIVNTLIWGGLDKNAKMMEPLYQLLHTQGLPLNSLDEEDYMTLWPFLDIFVAIRSAKHNVKDPDRSKQNSDFAFPSIILGTNAAWLFTVFWNVLALSDTTSIPMLLYLVICEAMMLLALLFIFAFRRTPVVPRQPVTLASILMYIYATDIVESLYPEIPKSLPSQPLSEVDQHDPASSSFGSSSLPTTPDIMPGCSQPLNSSSSTGTSCESLHGDSTSTTTRSISTDSETLVGERKSTSSLLEGPGSSTEIVFSANDNAQCRPANIETAMDSETLKKDGIELQPMPPMADSKTSDVHVPERLINKGSVISVGGDADRRPTKPLNEYPRESNNTVGEQGDDEIRVVETDCEKGKGRVMEAENLGNKKTEQEEIGEEETKEVNKNKYNQDGPEKNKDKEMLMLQEERKKLIKCAFGEFDVGSKRHVGISLYKSRVRPYEYLHRDPEA